MSPRIPRRKISRHCAFFIACSPFRYVSAPPQGFRSPGYQPQISWRFYLARFYTGQGLSVDGSFKPRDIYRYGILPTMGVVLKLSLLTVVFHLAAGIQVASASAARQGSCDAKLESQA